MSLFTDLLYNVGLVAALLGASYLTISTAVDIWFACKPRKLIASGSMLVTGKGDVLLDDSLPCSRTIINDPDKHIVVCFDDDGPVNPPCDGGQIDTVDWALLFKHRHNRSGACRDSLKLKVIWDVSSSRTISWKVYCR